MARKHRHRRNLLELVPRKTEGQRWQVDDKGMVQIIIPREKLLDKLVRVFVKTPRTIRIHLDAPGSCVWKQIDGSRSVQELGEILEKEFGDNVKPLYGRLAAYIRILKNNRFIELG